MNGVKIIKNDSLKSVKTIETKMKRKNCVIKIDEKNIGIPFKKD